MCSAEVVIKVHKHMPKILCGMCVMLEQRLTASSHSVTQAAALCTHIYKP